ncbi:hypothetical protein [Bacillus sp. AK128]
MDEYKINHMIVDEHFQGEESVTVEFTYQQNNYSITYNKEDFEVINSWYFKEDQTIPANLSDTIIESIREEIKHMV